MTITVRHPVESDHPRVTAALNSWWDLPQLQTPIHLGFRLGSVPRLFFQHFSSSCLLAEQEEKLLGFLVGLRSQDHPVESYVHFVGSSPEARRQGIASMLYRTYFNTMRLAGVKTIRCLTDIDNTVSQAFHQTLGFTIEGGDAERNGIRYHSDYDGPSLDRVVFVLHLGENSTL